MIDYNKLANFLLCSLDYQSPRPGAKNSISPSSLETGGDYCLQDLRYWFGGREYTILAGGESAFIWGVKDSPFLTSIEKIISIFRGILLFFPGVVLKAAAFIVDPGLKKRYSILTDFVYSLGTPLENLKINVQYSVQFFFLYSVKFYSMPQNTLYRASLLDEMADFCFKDLRDWLGGAEYTTFISNVDIPYTRTPIPRRYQSSFIRRIEGIVRGALLLIPGIVFRGTALLTQEVFRSRYRDLNGVEKNCEHMELMYRRRQITQWRNDQEEIQQKEKKYTQTEMTQEESARQPQGITALPFGVLSLILQKLNKEDLSSLAISNRVMYKMTLRFFAIENTILFPEALRLALQERIFKIPFVKPNDRTFEIFDCLAGKSRRPIHRVLGSQKIQRIETKDQSIFVIPFSSQVMIIHKDKKEQGAPWELLNVGLSEEERSYFSALFRNEPTKRSLLEISEKRQRFNQLVAF